MEGVAEVFVETKAEPRFLIIETSGRAGLVALARGPHLGRVRRLDEARRHARDLAPAVAELLAAEGWRPRDLQGVLVSRGPGSYTGLRVGLMSAKTLAYVTGCALVGVDTFAALALQAPEDALRLAVLADAQQEKVYVQTFARSAPGAPILPESPLVIRPFAELLEELKTSAWWSGPALRLYQNRLPKESRVVKPEKWDPQPESLLRIGLARYDSRDLDDPWTLEPLYLRPSSAEEKKMTR